MVKNPFFLLYGAIMLGCSVLVMSTALADQKQDDPCAQPSPQEMAKAAGVELPALPWHVANIGWDFSAPIEDFTSMEVDITIDRDVPSTYNLYISPCGNSTINGLMFYGGIQTNINGWANRESRKRVHPGRGGIFSRWSSDKKTPIGLEHVREAGPDCLVESAGYEGEFASVRRPFDWKAGTYVFAIVKGETVEAGETKRTWFTCQVKNEAGEIREIGSLLFEGETFTYGKRQVAFVEVYSTEKIPNSYIPEVEVSFGIPRINGEEPEVIRSWAFYPKQKPQGSPDCATVTAKEGKAVVSVGKIFVRDEKQRHHSLTLSEAQEAANR